MKPFLSGRAATSTPALQPLSPPIVKDGGVRISGHSHAFSGLVANDSESAPSVECVKQGDKVVRLIVTCTCGERIEIDCLYPGIG